MTVEIFLWATLPAILISIYIARKDLFPEPKAAIIAAIAFGFLTFIPHYLFFKIIGDFYWQIIENNFHNEQFINLTESLFQAAFVEESLKYLVFLFLIARFNAFNEPMDAIVYGVCISLGFSLMETLEWSHINFNNYGEAMALENAQVRSYSSNILHAGCGVTMGYILSRAFFQKKNSFLMLYLALLIPILIHGFYNFSILTGAWVLTIIFLIICALLVLFGWRKSRERQKLKKMETEDKVISLNIINISGSVLISFIVIVMLILLLK